MQILKQKKRIPDKNGSKIDETVQASIEAHTVSDVEVGSFLSSGVDSSYVTSVLKPDHSSQSGLMIKPIMKRLKPETNRTIGLR